MKNYAKVLLFTILFFTSNKDYAKTISSNDVQSGTETDTESVIVKEGVQYTINGDLTVNGDFTANGATIIINGSLYVKGTFSCYSVHHTFSYTTNSNVTITGRLITDGDISVEGYSESQKSSITVNNGAIMYTHNDLHIREHGILTLHPNSITITDGNLEHNGTVGFADVYAGEVNADHAIIVVQGKYKIYSSPFGVEDNDVEYINPKNNPEFYAFKGNELSKIGIKTPPGDEDSFNSKYPAGLAGFISHVLPIELVYFHAHEIGYGVRFEWETASELNNDYFTIEFSIDAVEFSELTKIDGAGTTTEPQNYRYTDFSSHTGIIYYRLKQTDYDGNFSYSETVPVIFAEHHEAETEDIKFVVYPNPATDHITISGGEYESISFVSANGAVLGREAAQGSHDITRLPKGLNFVIIHTANGDVSERFIKR